MINASFLEGKPVHVRLTDGALAGSDDVLITSVCSGGGLRVNIKNVSEKCLRVSEIALFAGEVDLPKETKFYGEGYHMLSQYRGDMENLEVIGAYGDDKSFFHLPDNRYDQDCHIAYYLLEFISGQERCLLAFSSCHKFLSKFRFKENYLECVLDAEGLCLHPGEAWDMEELVVYAGADFAALYRHLAASIARNHPLLPLPPGIDPIPTGWCSYYCVGILSPEALYQNAEAMARRVPELSMIQIDAGLNPTDGDWLLPAFEDDLAAACEKVRSYGVKAGGYCSPFIVNMDSRLYAEHPEWLVRDEAGNPTSRRSHRPDWCILDGTHPGARAYLKRIARYLHDSCGLRYVKLDFLSYGALPAGRRYDETKTSVEAYRMGMRAILEEIGGDTFVLACNAPFWPTLGLAHGNRSTNDIFRDWKHVSGNALEQFYRNWQHQRLWANDPDCVLLEKLDIIRRKGGQPVVRPCTLTDDEFEFHKAFGVASGGMLLSGDLLEAITDRSIDALKRMMAARGEAAVFDDDTFEVGRFATKKLICLFNWADVEKSFMVRVDGTGRLEDFWTDAELGVYDGGFSIRLPAHGGRVLRMKEESK